MRRDLPIVLLLLCALLCPAWGGCDAIKKALNRGDDDDSADDDSGADVDASLVPVRVKPARSGQLETTVTSSSTVMSVHQVDLITETSGTCRSVQVEEGDVVARGKTLATLDNPLAKGERDRALASYNKAQEDLERLRGLHDKGFISDNEWTEAVHAHDLAKTTYEQAQASLDDTTIRAPFAGTISFRDLEVGENVTVGKRVFQVVDMENLEVEVHLPERHMPDLKAGQKARISSEFSDLTVEGEVKRIHPTVDPTTGTLKVTIGVTQEQPVLRPGMFVNVDVITSTLDQATLIPKRAVVYEDGEPVAYVVREDKAVRVELGEGQEQGDEREVADGIEPTDRVIVMGQTALKDGSAVKIVGE